MMKMNVRRGLCTAVAVAGLGFGSAALLHADDMKMGDMDMGDMTKTMEEQEKTMAMLKTNYDDATFVTVASMANTDEIKAGDAAQSMSSNQDVKDFAKMMVDDHTKAGEEMKALGEKKNWHVSEKCDAKHLMAMMQMKKMTPTEFDKSYVVAQVKDHEDTVALLKLAEEKSSDSDLKDWIKGKIPTFEDHLKMAKKLEDKLMATPS